MKSLTFAWSHGECGVSLTAGMLTSCVFDLHGRRFDPFARATWVPSDMPALPGHLRTLGAEFVCVPFGEGGPLAGAVDEWTPLIDGEVNTPPHGMAANSDWQLADLREDGVTLHFEFPEGHDIERLERRIDGVPGEPALRVSLIVIARRPARTSVGLHPIVRLPDRPRSLRVEADFDVGFTYPAPVPPGRSHVLPGRRISRLDEVPTREGVEDFTRVPFEAPTEEVIQLAGMRGPVRVVFDDEGAGVEVDWDRSILSSMQLWLSDRALQDAPWCGTYRGLGIEPVASAFDLADSVSIVLNPISAEGYATAVDIVPGEPLRIDYSLRAFLQK